MTDIQEDASVLAHYGVKGMRWGVRKQRKPSTRKPMTPQRAARAKKAQNEFIQDMAVAAGASVAAGLLGMYGANKIFKPNG